MKMIEKGSSPSNSKCNAADIGALVDREYYNTYL